MAAVLAKAFTYAATFGVAGGVFFLRYSHDLLTAADTARIQRILRVWVGVAVLCSAARILVLAGSMQGALAGMFNRPFLQMILRAGEGPATGVRIAGLLAAGYALCSLRRPGLLAMAGAIAAATSFAGVGHPRAAALSVVPMMLESAHLLCVGFWLGALTPLWVMARQPDTARAAATAERFGRMAVFVVAALVAAGGGLMWILIGDAGELLDGAYGRALLTKLALVAGLLGVAAINKLRLTQRLSTHGLRAARSFARSIQFELALGGLILLVTAALTTVWGPAGLE